MDKEKEIEHIREELSALKEKNPSFYDSSISNVAKHYVSEHKEIESDKNLQLMLRYAVAKIGKDKVDEIVKRHFTPYSGQFEDLLKGTQKEPSSQLNLLYMRLSGAVERASLAHNVYVLGRTKINKDIEFKNEEVDEETGKRKKHRTMSLELWDNDTKKIIPLFLVDDQIEPHSALMPNKAYKMLVGNYDETKKRWYASKDPSIMPLDDSFELDQRELVKYLMETYDHVTEPFDAVVADIKENPGKKYVFLGSYVKRPGYVSLMLSDQSPDYTVMMYYSTATKDLLSDDGRLIVLGNLSKTKPKEGQITGISDYTMNPDFVVDLSGPRERPKPSDANEKDAKSSTEKTEKEIKAELDGVL